MLYIDKTYFIRKLAVPNTNEPTSDASIDLEMSIDRYVTQFLQETLGNVLNADLEFYTTDGDLSDTAPQKWLNLFDGCSYDKDGKLYTWRGLRYTNGAFQVSIMANYVYLNHFSQTFNSSLGQIVIEGKNATNADSTPHLVDVYNEFVEMYQGNHCNHPIRQYRNGVTFVDYFGTNSNNSGYVSYLQFLKDNEADYPNVPAQYLEFQNSFGL